MTDRAGGAIPDISIVVPFYNEEDNVGDLLAEIRTVMSTLGKSYEVLCVNDGSRDRTGEILRDLARQWPECRPLDFAANHGQACGLYYAIHQARAPIVATLDGDGQNDPADIPKLLAILGDADLVAGRRANRNDSWLRKRMSRFANAIRSRILRDGVRDSGCGLKVFRREVAEALIPIRTLYSFIPALTVAAGFRIIEQDVQHRPRLKGQSNYGLGVMLWRPLVDMLGVLWFINRRFTPPCRIALKPNEAPH